MPPVDPMLAKLQDEIPRGDEWLYEPKWDGFRAIVFRDGDELHIESRDGRPLGRYFPEMVAPLKDSLPARCVIDGEVVIASEEGLDFDALLLRIHPARSRIELLAQQTPGSFVAFDLLALADDDLTTTPFEERRAQLEDTLRTAILDFSRSDLSLFSTTGSRVFLTPQSSDADEANEWFQRFEDLGLDGVIAKRKDLGYVPGERVMVKVKRRRTADCVVGGYRLSKSGDGVGSLLLGLYDDNSVLNYVGHTSSFKAIERRELLAALKELHGEGGFGAGRSPGGPSRWAHQRETGWTPVRPVLVCEVSYDRMQGERFRHATTFLRWRTDRDPRSCTFDQVFPSARRP